MQIQQLASDTALKYNIKYSISGPGVDHPPLNVFYVEKETGNLFVTCPIDREEYPEFHIICYATTPEGYTPETPLVHIIRIDDENDNPPVFDRDVFIFYICENSRIGTVVGQVTATDRDEPNTLHTRVKYRIVSQDLQTYHSSVAFAIHPELGSITVASADLDRETASEYKLKIEARDLDGDELGLCSTVDVIVMIEDTNDNIPQLVQTMYEVEIYENTENIELLRIAIKDDDDFGTPSWLATFTIIEGNEDNTFSITVDRETNEGVLCALKGLDYEQVKERRLEIVVNNEAPYDPASNARGLSMNTATVIIKIRNQDEGPVFDPCEYILHIKECLPRGTVVGNYQARDPETENSEGMRYRIINDFCNWITINHKGQLKTTKMLDRDALNMEDSPCNVTIRATDRSGKTGIGKIVIYLVDENDNYPVITRKNYIMCEDEGPIFITAFDADLPPYSGPFHFDIEEPMSATWSITPHDDESALLALEEDINYGNYTIVLKISDNEGHSGISEIMLHYCNCVIPNGIMCEQEEKKTGSGKQTLLPRAKWQQGQLLSYSLGTDRHLDKPPAGMMNAAVSMNAGEMMNAAVRMNAVETMNAAVSMNTVKGKIGSREGLEVIQGEGRLTPDLDRGGCRRMAQSLLSLRKSYRDLHSEWQNFTNSHLAEVLSVFCEACKKVTFNVPSNLEAGTLIGKVNLKRCLRTSNLVSSTDPNFLILEDGSVYTTNAVSLSSEKKAFSIVLKDLQEHKQKEIHVNLLSHSKKTHKPGEIVLRRSKRRWAPVPTLLMENSLGPFPMQIKQLVSDTSERYNITYSISGPGVDRPPLNYFYIEKETGNLFVTRPIDREEYEQFEIICYAKTVDGYTPELPLQHVIRIGDDNDNPPIFDPDTCTFTVLENSRSGTVIGQMTATDRDEPGTLHTKLKYRIVSQNPLPQKGPGIFNINPDSGSITLVTPTLDREGINKYILQIEARDMGGQSYGLCNTGTAIIEVADANDHAPMCEHERYEASVLENTAGAKVVDITVLDQDERGTPGWHATLNIIKGNEDGAFKIETNQDSNVGTLCVQKGLDYEKNKERRLEIVVVNAAPYVLAPNSRPISTSTCYVTVKVQNVDEGPAFEPSVYILNVKERTEVGTMVGQYLARDPETGNSEGIRYRIINDPCKWITINDAGQIRTTSLLDRDIPDLQMHQCNVTVSATDRSGKTGTGVVVVNLEDENDNFPVIPPQDYVMCRDKEPVLLTAVDADLPPNTTPFSFGTSDPRWRIIPNDDKSAFLTPVGQLDYGDYVVPVMDPNILPVKTGNVVTSDQGAGMGAVGIKAGGPECFEMVKGTKYQTLESQGRGHLTLDSAKGGGSHTLDGRGYGQSAAEAYRYSYSEWQNFTHPQLTERLYLCGQDEEHKNAEDYVLSYNYEGRGSPAGSVGCCTDQQDEEALDFLDQLEPKFRTLAETCIKR
ncbi:hypothetical protein lerEdw1_012604 [Lerista edwardsae]|nr:hypothetical protein lerEdw1_012604 [Lerista edwardsae]